MADRDPPLLFALLGLFALVDAFGDVATVLLDPRDLPLLRTQPIAPRDYVRARFSALLVPIGVKTLALGVPVAAALLGHGRGVRAAAAFFAAFGALQIALAAGAALLPPAAAASVARLAVAGGARVAARAAPGRRDRPAGSCSSARRMRRGRRERRARRPGSGARRSCRRPGSPSSRRRSAAGRSAAGSSPPRSRWWPSPPSASRCSHRPTCRCSRGSRAASRRARAGRRRCGRAFERGFVARDERPGFRLGVALLRRERTFRLQTLPLLAYPLLFLWLGRGAEDGGLLALLFAQLPAVALALCSMFLRFSDSPAGGFALRFACDGARATPLVVGSRKAMWYVVALPLAFAVAALLAWDRGPAFGLAVGSAGLLAATFALLGSAPRGAELPFVERFQGRIESGEGGEGGRVFGLLFLLALLAGIEWQAVRAGSAGQLLLAGSALAGSAFLLRRKWAAVGADGGGVLPIAEPVVVTAAVPPLPRPAAPRAARTRRFLRPGRPHPDSVFAWI
jgi:hypothetical protein